MEVQKGQETFKIVQASYYTQNYKQGIEAMPSSLQYPNLMPMTEQRSVMK